MEENVCLQIKIEYFMYDSRYLWYDMLWPIKVNSVKCNGVL